MFRQLQPRGDGWRRVTDGVTLGLCYFSCIASGVLGSGGIPWAHFLARAWAGYLDSAECMFLAVGPVYMDAFRVRKQRVERGPANGRFHRRGVPLLVKVGQGRGFRFGDFWHSVRYLFVWERVRYALG
jgi:hypothetical protein